jgi:hypothetical protein
MGFTEEDRVTLELIKHKVNDLCKVVDTHEQRIDHLCAWKNRTIGGLTVLTFLIAILATTIMTVI